MRLVPLILTAALAGCVHDPRVPLEDLSRVPQGDLLASQALPIYTIDSTARPAVAQALGPVSGWSCKHVLSDPPASRGEALQRLRLVAYRLHADAVVDVTFDRTGADAYGTDCWQAVQASGEAVKVKAP